MITSESRVVILTGAGISAESGIRTFRDFNGLWENHRIEEVATPEGWEANPQLVWGFYQQRRRQLFDVEPNSGHRALVDLEEYLDNFLLITQNVDVCTVDAPVAKFARAMRTWKSGWSLR